MTDRPAIVIPSHNRHDRIVSHQVVAGAIVAVAEDQAEAYARRVPEDRIVTHPPTVVGLARKRQWILDRWPDVFMLDDDVTALLRIYRSDRPPDPLTPDEARDRIVMTRDTAEELGAYLYGFSPWARGPKQYLDWMPLSFGEPIWGPATGLRAGSKLHWPDLDQSFDFEDVWINALNRYHHRYSFLDRRFVVAHDYETMPGGRQDQAGHRDTSFDRTMEVLQRNFGTSITATDSESGRKRRCFLLKTWDAD